MMGNEVYHDRQRHHVHGDVLHPQKLRWQGTKTEHVSCFVSHLCLSLLLFFYCLTFWKVNKYGQKWETFFYMDWSTLIVRAPAFANAIQKAQGHKHSSLIILERLCLTTVPYICIMYVLPYAFHCAFHNKAKPLWLVQRGKPQVKTGDFPIYISNQPNLWYHCIVVRRVGFSLCTQMWQGYLSPVVSSLNAPAVTLPVCLSPLYFSSSKLCLTVVHLKHIYKKARDCDFQMKSYWIPSMNSFVNWATFNVCMWLLLHRPVKHEITLMNV